MGDAKMELPSLRKVTTSAEPSVNAAPEESCGDRLFVANDRKKMQSRAAADADSQTPRRALVSLFFFCN